MITEEGQILGIINFEVKTVRDGEEIAVVKQIL